MFGLVAVTGHLGHATFCSSVSPFSEASTLRNQWACWSRVRNALISYFSSHKLGIRKRSWEREGGPGNAKTVMLTNHS